MQVHRQMQGGTEREGGERAAASPRRKGREGRDHVQSVQRQEDALTVAARPRPREVNQVVGVYQHPPARSGNRH